jgi:hypothetical protein
VSADAGYPYFAEVRINVGAGRVGQFGFDAGVGARTNLARNEIGLGVRMTLFDKDPFSAGVFGDLWWGSKLLDDSKRNGVTFNAGVLASRSRCRTSRSPAGCTPTCGAIATALSFAAGRSTATDRGAARATARVVDGEFEPLPPRTRPGWRPDWETWMQMFSREEVST